MVLRNVFLTSKIGFVEQELIEFHELALKNDKAFLMVDDDMVCELNGHEMELNGNIFHMKHILLQIIYEIVSGLVLKIIKKFEIHVNHQNLEYVHLICMENL